MLNEIRNQATKVYSETGYPSSKNEMWKYTNVNSFNGYTQPDLRSKDFKLDTLDLEEDFFNIIICNGYIVKIESKIEGVNINNYNQIKSTISTSSSFLKLSSYKKNSVVSHNTSLFTDALHITVKSNVNAEVPINIINIANSLSENNIIFPRIFIHAESNSNSKIYFEHFGDEIKCAINSVFEVFCESSSEIEIIHRNNAANQEIIDSFFLHQETDSKIKFLSAAFGGRLYRSNFELLINGESCDNNIGVLMLGSEDNHIDCHANINHLSGNSKNNFLCRSLMKDNSKGIFNGKILVAKGAEGTDSELNNNNLILSDNAGVQSNPQLEIYSEDVKCAHGSTTGNLDEEAIFYLKSRGINEKDSRKILVEGFIGKLLSKFNLETDSFQEAIKKWI